MLIPLVGVFDQASCLLYSCVVEKMDEEMVISMKPQICDLLEKTNVKEIYMAVLRATKLFNSSYNPLPLETEFYLLENMIKLLDCNASSVIYLNDPSEKLHEKLKFLKTFIADTPLELRLEKFNYLVASIEAITLKAIPLLYSCDEEEMKEETAKEVNGALSEVLDRIELIQVDVREIKLYDCPKTDGLGFLDFFLGNLEKLQDSSRSQLVKFLKNQIESLHVEFDFLRSFLRNIKLQHNEHKDLEDIWTRVISLAYRAEHVIDIALVKRFPESRIMLSLSKVIDQVELIKSDVVRIIDEKTYDVTAKDVPTTLSHGPSEAPVTATDEVVVGFEDETQKIMEYLVGDVMQLQVVSIVGMGGLGKTTLAKKIYNDPSVVQRFDVQAWCCVSQTYQKRDLLLDILCKIIEVGEEVRWRSLEDLAELLYRSLKGRRYFIVIDDIWDIKAWDDLVRTLPDDRKGSRVIITSRHHKLASQIKSYSKVHTLRELSNDESWELFQKKLYPEESFSSELIEVGRRIAESCKGLPLAIVVVAGLLAKEEKTVEKWKRIAESLNSHILGDSESPCKAILDLSYNHLPDHLKPCFLYVGVFPEDKQIPVWKLKWLWIAEGFVQNVKSENLEELAEEYFMDLIGRSLITATKERSQGGVKLFRVHDLLRDLCLEKAKEENFMQLLNVDGCTRFSRVYDQYRLSISSKVYDLMKAKPSGFSVRSLLYTQVDKSTVNEYDASFISHNFGLLRVLDLADINIGKSLNYIELLVHLRYLAVSAELASIPSSLSSLWNLQTFIVKATRDYGEGMVDVPDSVWDMVNLRHVHINHHACFNVHPNRLENSLFPENVETLSTPCLSSTKEAENLLTKLPKLRKLRCAFSDCWDQSSDCFRFPALDFLAQLISLKVILLGSRNFGKKNEFNFPSNLKKLTLSKFGLSWTDVSDIGMKLHSLEVLKLHDSGYGGTWNASDGGFKSLTYLKLRSSGYICEWFASADSFPKLEQLVLDDCKHLREIPLCFGEIPSMRMITVKHCRPSVYDSAMRIQVEQKEEMLNEDFKVHINSSKPRPSY